MIITITRKCNNNCKHCYITDEHYQKACPLDSMPKEEIKSKILQEKKNGLKVINFFGGEPTLHPNFFELVKFLKENDMKLNLNSNLRIFFYENFVEKLLQHSNLSFVHTSLYASTPQIHDSITRVRGSWEQTTQGIKNLLNHGFDPKNLMINIVMMSLNMESLRETVEFILNDLDHSIQIKFSFLQPEGNALGNIYLLPKLKDLYPHLLKAVNFIGKTGVEEVFIEKGPLCFCPNTKLVNYIYESEYFNDERHMKPKNCSGCPQTKCMGVHKNYFQTYGGSELSHINKLEIIIRERK